MKNEEKRDFFSNWIFNNEAEIKALRKELQNPRLRKPQKRIDAIEALTAQIKQCEEIIASL